MIGAPWHRCERRAVYDVDGTGSYGGGGDYGGNSYDSGGGGGGGETNGGGLGGNADPGGTFGPDGGAEGSSNWGSSGFETTASPGNVFSSIVDAINSVLDTVTGKPTNDRVVDAYLSALSLAVPGMGLGMALTSAARAAGYDVNDDISTDTNPATSAGGAGVPGGYSPPVWRTPAPNPLAPSPYATDLPAWAGTVPPATGPYAQDVAPGAQAAVSASDGTPAASGASAGEKTDILPLLLLGAGILAGLA